MMECNFHVGQMVVCVDASPPRDHITDPLMLRRIYTVRGICYSGGIQLEEIVARTRNAWGEEKGWRSQRFRPVRTTDISTLRELVAPRPKVSA